MDHLGVDLAERSTIEQLAYRQNQTSKRNTNVIVPLRPLCPSKLKFVMELEMWQRRQHQPQNITFNNVLDAQKAKAAMTALNACELLLCSATLRGYSSQSIRTHGTASTQTVRSR